MVAIPCILRGRVATSSTSDKVPAHLVQCHIRRRHQHDHNPCLRRAAVSLEQGALVQQEDPPRSVLSMAAQSPSSILPYLLLLHLLWLPHPPRVLHLARMLAQPAQQDLRQLSSSMLALLRPHRAS